MHVCADRWLVEVNVSRPLFTLHYLTEPYADSLEILANKQATGIHQSFLMLGSLSETANMPGFSTVS